MTLSPRQRWMLWAGLLVGVLALWVLDPLEESPTVATAATRTPATTTAPLATQGTKPPNLSISPPGRTSGPELPALTPLRLRAELIGSVQPVRFDLFGIRDWSPLPVPVQVVVPPQPVPEPVAPPLPYLYLGKKLDEKTGRWEVYLSREETGTTYIVRPGSTVDEHYLVERIAPPVMVLRYRPLNQKQELHIGESSW